MLRKFKEKLNSPITWKGCWKLCVIAYVITIVIYAVGVAYLYWESIVRCFNKLFKKNEADELITE